MFNTALFLLLHWGLAAAELLTNDGVRVTQGYDLNYGYSLRCSEVHFPDAYFASTFTAWQTASAFCDLHDGQSRFVVANCFGLWWDALKTASDTKWYKGQYVSTIMSGYAYRQNIVVALGQLSMPDAHLRLLAGADKNGLPHYYSNEEAPASACFVPGDVFPDYAAYLRCGCRHSFDYSFIRAYVDDYIPVVLMFCNEPISPIDMNTFLSRRNSSDPDLCEREDIPDRDGNILQHLITKVGFYTGPMLPPSVDLGPYRIYSNQPLQHVESIANFLNYNDFLTDDHACTIPTNATLSVERFVASPFYPNFMIKYDNVPQNADLVPYLHAGDSADGLVRLNQRANKSDFSIPGFNLLPPSLDPPGTRDSVPPCPGIGEITYDSVSVPETLLEPSMYFLDAPSQASLLCGNSVCPGWGTCPTDNNLVVCGGNGECLYNGLCRCNANWMGIACNISIPSRNSRANCSVYNPCGPTGDCYDNVTALFGDKKPLYFAIPRSDGFENVPFTNAYSDVYCKCHLGWAGSLYMAHPSNKNTSILQIVYSHSTLNLYTNSFHQQCDARVPSAYSSYPSAGNFSVTRLGYQTDSSPYFWQFVEYVAHHQCLFFVGHFDSASHSQLHYPADTARQGKAVAITPYNYLVPVASTLSVLMRPYWVTRHANLALVNNYICSDERQNRGNLHGGTHCLPCPDCRSSSSVCADGDTPYTTKCACFENYIGATCNVTMCPIAAGQDHACGYPHSGFCNTNASAYNSSFAYACYCYDGYAGAACDQLVCNKGPNGKICSGGTPAPNLSPDDYAGNTTVAHGYCNETTSTCVCRSGFTNEHYDPALRNVCWGGTCPSYNGSECSGLKYFDDSTRSVCNRALPDINGTRHARCDCLMAVDPSQRSVAPLYGRWGADCSQTYLSACGDPDDTMPNRLCNGRMSSCLSSEPNGRPTCQCEEGYTGAYCQYSACDLSAYRGQGCWSKYGGQTTLNPVVPSGECIRNCRSSDYTDPQRCTDDEAAEGYGCYCRAVRMDNFQVCPEGQFGPSVGTPQCHLFYGKLCQLDGGNCTYYDTNSRFYTLCNNKGTCDNGTCTCQTGYTGSQCETPVGCGGNCNAFGGNCVSNVCKCKQSFSGATCTVNRCNATNGTVDRNSGNCICGSNAVFYPPANNTDYVLPVSATYQGCRKRCVQNNGVECGSLTSDLTSRCSAISYVTGDIISALNVSMNVSCNCTMLDPYSFSWFPTADGSCERKCLHGSQDPMQINGDCNCAVCDEQSKVNGICQYGAELSGPVRCSRRKCVAPAVFTLDSVCICPNMFNGVAPTYNATTGCLDPCGPNGYSDSRVAWCRCYPPYHESRDSTQPLCKSPCGNGVANITSGNCSCPVTRSGTNCETLLCAYGTVENEAKTRCVCPGHLSGLYCNTVNCSNGTLGSDNRCKCDTLFVTDTSGRCTVDTCKLNGYSGTANNLTCACDTGYAKANGSVYCSSRCDPGRVELCGGSTNITCLNASLGYNCRCGGAYNFSSNNGTCTRVSCGNGLATVDTNASVITKCICYNGWSGVKCDTYVCGNATSLRARYDNGSCTCNPPWTGSNCSQHTCINVNADTPVKLVSGTTPLSALYECNCLPGYILNAPLALITGLSRRQCLPACNYANTVSYSDRKTCHCKTGYEGALCDQVVVTNTSATLHAAEIAWIVVGGVVGFALLTYLGYRLRTHSFSSLWSGFRIVSD